MHTVFCFASLRQPLRRGPSHAAESGRTQGRFGVGGPQEPPGSPADGRVLCQSMYPGEDGPERRVRPPHVSERIGDSRGLAQESSGTIPPIGRRFPRRRRGFPRKGEGFAPPGERFPVRVRQLPPKGEPPASRCGRLPRVNGLFPLRGGPSTGRGESSVGPLHDLRCGLRFQLLSTLASQLARML